RLAECLPPTGTSLKNPVDVSLTGHLEPEIFFQTVRAVSTDPGVDALVIMGGGIDEESTRVFTESMIEIRRESGKPFLMAAIPGVSSETMHTFCQAGIPFFPTAERAMDVYARVLRYQTWLRKRRT
ncbi:MAG: hypothetical protein V1742_03035, partial [Pseudomonadota bacterium]